MREKTTRFVCLCKVFVKRFAYAWRRIPMLIRKYVLRGFQADQYLSIFARLLLLQVEPAASVLGRIAVLVFHLFTMLMECLGIILRKLISAWSFCRTDVKEFAVCPAFGGGTRTTAFEKYVSANDQNQKANEPTNTNSNIKNNRPSNPYFHHWTNTKEAFIRGTAA